MLEGRSDDFAKHFLRHALLQPAALPAAAGDHPRPPTRSGGRRAVLEEFGERVLGKGMVRRKDTPELHRQPHRRVHQPVRNGRGH